MYDIYVYIYAHIIYVDIIEKYLYIYDIFFYHRKR